MDATDSFPLSILIAISATLVLLSMIFSATESAFLSVNKLRVRFLRNKKNKRAVRVWRLLQDKSRLINTLLVANNIVNIALSSIFSFVAIKIWGSKGVGFATFAVTIILLIFGEISPKTIATHHPEAIAFFFSGFISVLEVVLSPLVFVFTKISKLILTSMKVSTQKAEVTFTEEEIKTFIDVGHEQGVLEKNEKNLMAKVFKFSDLEAKAIMIPRKKIKAVSITDSYRNIIEQSERFRLSKFPVYKKDIDDIVGIIYVKDMLVYKTHPELFTVSRVMRPPLFILGTKKMSGIQQMLRENHQSMAVVIDEYSGTDGILTVEDIVREIFGPVTDEYKAYAHKVEVKIRNTRNEDLDGLSRLIDINEQLGTKIESENCETIGGYISEHLGSIPRVGQSVVAGDYKFIVTEMDENRVAKVKMMEVAQ
ncbi:MAG: HlyC/CorC family transporter [Treponema sp.]|nr:HlyC/CorC family transporter [Candidatus Treponema equi]